MHWIPDAVTGRGGLVAHWEVLLCGGVRDRVGLGGRPLSRPRPEQPSFECAEGVAPRLVVAIHLLGVDKPGIAIVLLARIAPGSSDRPGEPESPGAAAVRVQLYVAARHSDGPLLRRICFGVRDISREPLAVECEQPRERRGLRLAPGDRGRLGRVVRQPRIQDSVAHETRGRQRGVRAAAAVAWEDAKIRVAHCAAGVAGKVVADAVQRADIGAADCRQNRQQREHVKPIHAKTRPIHGVSTAQLSRIGKLCARGAREQMQRGRG